MKRSLSLMCGCVGIFLVATKLISNTQHADAKNGSISTVNTSNRQISETKKMNRI